MSKRKKPVPKAERFFTCALCTVEPLVCPNVGDMVRHLVEAHGKIEAHLHEAYRQLQSHLDARDWHSTVYEYKLNGETLLYLTQTFPRAKDDPMRFD